MWTNPTALGSAPAQLSIEWNSTNAPSTIISDVTMGVRPAYVTSRPPKLSSSEWWSLTASNGSEELFEITVPVDTIIDVLVDIRFVDNQEDSANGDNPTGATPGVMYYNYLDGLTSGKLTPVGGVTILP